LRFGINQDNKFIEDEQGTGFCQPPAQKKVATDRRFLPLQPSQKHQTDEY